MKLSVIDDMLSEDGETVFEFSDGSTAMCIQHHNIPGAPWEVVTEVSIYQAKAIKEWTGCRVL